MDKVPLISDSTHFLLIRFIDLVKLLFSVQRRRQERKGILKESQQIFSSSERTQKFPPFFISYLQIQERERERERGRKEDRFLRIRLFIDSTVVEMENLGERVSISLHGR